MNCECADYKLWSIFFVLYFISLLNFYYFFSSDFALELGVLGVVVCMVYVIVLMAGKVFQPSDVQL